jgi:hypothetical protein
VKTKRNRKHPDETPGKQLKDEIMKTKITTIIGLVALGLIGFTSNNATAANNLMSSLITVETKTAKVVKVEAEKPLDMIEGITEEDFFKAAETYTASGSDKEIEKYADKQIHNLGANVETGNNLEAYNDFFNDAESYTAAGSDKEVKKYADKQITLQNER